MRTTFTPEEITKIVERGNEGERLLKDTVLMNFIQQYRYECCEELSTMSGHSTDHNSKRIAIANKLAGIEEFVATLRGAVSKKNNVVNQMNNSNDPTIYKENN